MKFIEKHDLPFSLISDERKEVLNDYGVWGLKNLQFSSTNPLCFPYTLVLEI